MPAGVLCEVLNETGDRANRDELAALAKRFELPIISIEQLIAHRRVREKLVYREAEAALPNEIRRREDHRLRREVRIAAADGVRAGRTGESCARRWCGFIPPVSRAISWSRSAAIAATSSTWRWR